MNESRLWWAERFRTGLLGGDGQGRLGDDCAGCSCPGVLGGGQGGREVLVLVIWVSSRGT